MLSTWNEIYSALEEYVIPLLPSSPSSYCFKKCENDYDVFIVVLRCIPDITVTNEIARMPFVVDKDFAMFRGIGLEPVAILNLTRGVFCDYVHHLSPVISTQRYFTYRKHIVCQLLPNENFIPNANVRGSGIHYYKTLRAVFEACYAPSGYVGNKTQFDENGKPILTMQYCEDGRTVKHHDFLLSDGVMQQQFQNRNFHGEQKCVWNNGAMLSINFENGHKHGPFSFTHGERYLIGAFDKDVALDFLYFDQIYTTLTNVDVPANIHWRFIANHILAQNNLA